MVNERPDKVSGLYRIWTHDLCSNGAALYQLSQPANRELVIKLARNKPVKWWTNISQRKYENHIYIYMYINIIENRPADFLYIYIYIYIYIWKSLIHITYHRLIYIFISHACDQVPSSLCYNNFQSVKVFLFYPNMNCNLQLWFLT